MEAEVVVHCQKVEGVVALPQLAAEVEAMQTTAPVPLVPLRLDLVLRSIADTVQGSYEYVSSGRMTKNSITSCLLCISSVSSVWVSPSIILSILSRVIVCGCLGGLSWRRGLVGRIAI